MQMNCLCRKDADPRVHRIATGLRTPTDPKLLLELSKSLAALKPATPKKASAEAGEQVAEDGESPPPPPPPATVLLDRAMSTLLRVPFQPPPPTPEEVAKKEAAEKEAARLETLKKLQKDDLKVQAKKESKLGGKKEEKNEVGKKSDKKGSGKKGPDKKKGKKGKKGEKDEIEDKPQVEEILPPPDSGVWEDICIDRLSDYATLIDSD
ncbi:hypothetical protein R1sor_005992 [Riccia sorocarpa]|uniref:Uncharacterized protein n=1 Tax=Riccia sorocarpa TaxID=122646 RepID=A0ABD3HN74_9MARC